MKMKDKIQHIERKIQESGIKTQELRQEIQESGIKIQKRLVLQFNANLSLVYLPATIDADRLDWGKNAVTPLLEGKAVNVCAVLEEQKNGSLETLLADRSVAGLYVVLEEQKSATGCGEIASGRVNMTDGSNKIASGRVNMTSGRRKIASGRINMTDGSNKIASGRINMTSGCRKTASGRVNLSCGGSKVVRGRVNLACGTRQMRVSEKLAHAVISKQHRSSSQLAAN